MKTIFDGKTNKDVALYVVKSIAIRVVITIGAVLITDALIKKIEPKIK